MRAEQREWQEKIRRNKEKIGRKRNKTGKGWIRISQF